MLIHVATDNDIHPPLFGGTERTFGLARGLARRHAVHVLCVVPNRTVALREQTVDGVALVRRKAWYTSAAWRLERWRLAPMAVALGWHAAAARGLLAALPGEPDVLFADLMLSGLFAASAAPLRVYASQNVEYDHFEATRGAAVHGAAGWRERVRAAEARAVATADLTVVCSDGDAARMRELYGVEQERLVVAPNGYDETRVTPPDADRRERARARIGVADDEYAALFVGSDMPHNREALAFLVEEVGPALARERVRLIVVGAVTRALRGRRKPWLTAIAETPDLAPALHAADAGLNPVLSGGGSNVKVPTYLAAGLEVLSTSFGLRGYAALAPHVRVVEREHTVDVLRTRPAGWAARGEPRPAVVADYAWGTIGERLGETLEARRGGRVPVAGAGGARA